MKWKSALLCVLLLVGLTCTAYAHPGRTDANGGHYNRSTGEYHYHHGYPAHQHYGGVCPYAYDDRTGQNSGSSGGSSGSSSSSWASGNSNSNRNSNSSTSSSGNSTAGSSSSSGQHSRTSNSSSTTKQRAKRANTVWLITLIFLAVILNPVLSSFIWFVIEMIKDAIVKARKRKRLDAPKKPPAAPAPPQVSPPEPPQRRPHRLDLSDRFNVSYNGKLITLYGLPCTQISHVGYLRETRQLFVRFRSSGLVDVYFDVPLAVCSEFVRSQYPDRYYSTFIDRKYLVQHIDAGTDMLNDS